MTGMSTRRCDRTRALLSQQLDGTLTEIQSRAVSRHTNRCAACCAFEAQVRWLTHELRGAPLEPPGRSLDISPVRVRRISRRVVGSAASVAATVVVAVGAWAAGTTANGEVTHDVAVPGGAAPGSVFGDGLRAIKVDALRAGALPILPPPPRHDLKPARPVNDF